MSCSVGDQRFSQQGPEKCISQLALKFVNTELLQLGSGDMVYAGDVHSRFEHSQVMLLASPEADQKLQIFVKCINGKTIALDVKSADTIADLKFMIGKKESIPPAWLHLVCGGKWLMTGNLDQNDVRDKSTIYVMFRLCGGMESNLVQENRGPGSREHIFSICVESYGAVFSQNNVAIAIQQMALDLQQFRDQLALRQDHSLPYFCLAIFGVILKRFKGKVTRPDWKLKYELAGELVLKLNNAAKPKLKCLPPPPSKRSEHDFWLLMVKCKFDCQTLSICKSAEELYREVRVSILNVKELEGEFVALVQLFQLFVRLQYMISELDSSRLYEYIGRLFLATAGIDNEADEDRLLIEIEGHEALVQVAEQEAVVQVAEQQAHEDEDVIVFQPSLVKEKRHGNLQFAE